MSLLRLIHIPKSSLYNEHVVLLVSYSAWQSAIEKTNNGPWLRFLWNEGNNHRFTATLFKFMKNCFDIFGNVLLY